MKYKKYLPEKRQRKTPSFHFRGQRDPQMVELVPVLATLELSLTELLGLSSRPALMSALFIGGRTRSGVFRWYLQCVRELLGSMLDIQQFLPGKTKQTCLAVCVR